MKSKLRIITQVFEDYKKEHRNSLSRGNLVKNLDISLGNIEYHFGNKKALFPIVYKQMTYNFSVMCMNKGKERQIK